MVGVLHPHPSRVVFLVPLRKLQVNKRRCDQCLTGRATACLPPGPGQSPAPYGMQQKAGMPPGAVPNGPPSGLGAQGDPYNTGAPPGPYTQPPSRPPGPGQQPMQHQQQYAPVSNANQLPGQMSGMSLSQGPPRPGMPLSSVPNQMGGRMPGPGPHGMQPPRPGPPASMAGPGPMSNAGPPMMNAGHPMSNAGPPMMNAGPPMSNAGPLMSGQPMSTAGPSMSGPPMSNAGPPMSGPPMSNAGPSMSGPPMSNTGPPMSGPPMSNAGPSMSGPPMSNAGPPMSWGHPPIQNAGLPNAGPPMAGPPMSGPSPMSMTMPPMYGTGSPTPMQQTAPTSNMPPYIAAQHAANAMPGGYGPPPPGGQPGPHPGGYGQPPPSPGALNCGQPPVPGYGQRGPPMGQSGPVPGQQQQARRLDPDQMPSVIQVVEDDRKNRSGVFQSTPQSSDPPLVTTDFYTEDQGNCNPRLMRSTMYNIPCTADMLKQSHVPFALNISPFAELHPSEKPLPVVDLGELGPIRCNRCKAYMCPYMPFIDGGRRFQCTFCHCHTEVPPEYFAHLDHTGKRMDYYDRPELCLGAYEFLATKDYCRNSELPKPPAFIFMIDVSYNSVKSGLVNLLCSRLKDDVLANLPKETGFTESEIRVGFVTYAKELHFYNVKSNLAQPQMLVVSDIQDVFVPLLDGFMVKLSESEAVIDSLLSQIPQMFADSRETEVTLGPVIQAGIDALKSANCCGKLFVFHTTMPLADAPGKLRNRDDRKLLGTEKEKTILIPQSSFYTKLGQECVAVGCGVDLFLFPNSYIDVATIAEVPRLTGGTLYKYSYFQADLDGERFLTDLTSQVKKSVAFDVIMRVRTSTGIRATDFYGNFFMSNTTDVEIGVMDSDKSVTVEIRHDDKLNEAEGATVQAACLYTNVIGQRRLRVLNLSFNCSMQLADMFRNCELDTVINVMAKQGLRQTLNGTPKLVRETITNQCAQILACYRKNCATPSSAGQLILPECMKLLPVYTNCVIKSNILQGGADLTTDDRSYLMHLVNAMPVTDSACFFYPRLLPLHDVDVNSEALPTALRCSYERINDVGVYLLENGLVMYLWIGINVSHDWLQGVFGVQSAAQVDIDKTTLQHLDNPLSRRICNIIEKVRSERHRYLKLTIVRQRDKLEPLFQQYLMEDRSANGSVSYVDYLCHIHKEIRNLLS
ncbi:Protein transport protein Sec24C [Lamellibrachia satsuma]|nr:Protein transport protein Sec24C [Lamellibrachia satsuma]